jgi:hypothetical protein
VESSVCQLFPPCTFSYVQEENSGSTRKCLEDYFFVYVYYQPNSCTRVQSQSMGWRNLSKIVGKKFLQPVCSKCGYIAPPWINVSVCQEYKKM